MDIVYLQCDARFNQWLMKKINERYIIEYTIQKAKELNCQKIIAGIYECDENRELINILNRGEVSVKLSKEDVNVRFLNIVANENAEYVIRMGGDQILADTIFINCILCDMKKQKKEWFYEDSAACILPDIVSIQYLKKHYKELLLKDRYFSGLEKQKIDRYRLNYPLILPFDFRVNSHAGYRICKTILEKELTVYDISKKLLKRFNTENNYLIKTGIWESWLFSDEEGFFFDSKEMINPWWAYSITDFLKTKLKKHWTVFEWGSGNSTLFLSQYVKHVVSLEHNRKWYEKMNDYLPGNVDLKYCSLDYDGNYCRAILEEKNKFDLIVIDGRDRIHCAENAVQKLNHNGVIIWDDTDVAGYKQGIDYLKKEGFKQLELSSVTYQLIGWKQVTSIFYKEDNILEI